MNVKDMFKSRIKYLLKKQGNYSKDEIELILLIIEILQSNRRKYAASAASAPLGFDFGIRALKKQQQISAAITLFERLLKIEHTETND